MASFTCILVAPWKVWFAAHLYLVRRMELEARDLSLTGLVRLVVTFEATLQRTRAVRGVNSLKEEPVTKKEATRLCWGMLMKPWELRR